MIFLATSQINFLIANIDHVTNVSVLMQTANLLRGNILETWVIQNSDGKDPRTMMLVWDTGDSYGLTPSSSGFIDYVECDILVKDVAKVNRVIKIGTTLDKFIERNCQYIFLPCISYQLTQTYVCLFSTQTYNQMHGGHYVVNGNQLTTHLPFHRIDIPVDIGGTNSPVVHI